MQFISVYAAIMLVIVCVWRIPVPVGQVRLSFQVLLELGVYVGVAIFVHRRCNKWVGWFLGLAIVSLFVPFYTKWSFLAFFAIFVMVIWYALLVINVSIADCEHLMDAMCVIALCHVLMQELQIMNMDPLFAPIHGQDDIPVGLMANVNETAALLSFTAPAFLRPKRYLGLIPVCAGLVFAKVSMGILTLAGGAVFYFIVQQGVDHRTFAYVLWAGCFSLLYFFFIDMPGVERWDVWVAGFEYFKKHWLFGYGLGHWKVVMREPIHNVVWKTAHFEFGQLLFETGILSVVIVVGYFVNIFRRFTVTALIPVTAVVIVVINCMANFAMHIAPTAIIAITWLAITEVYLRRQHEFIV